MLAEKNRRRKLHDVVDRFLEVMVRDPLLVEIEDAHHMDEASADLLRFVAGQLATRRWLFGVARRPAASGFEAPESPALRRIELKPLAPSDAVKMTQLATAQHPIHMHVVEAVAQRSGGNPQFLRDLARSAIATGGVGGLPDSAEAATMARIDALAPEDRAWIRRAAVFGQKFHPRMLAWFADEVDGTIPDPAAWARLQEFFEEEPEGYLRFRRSLLRDAAYGGLPYKLRRRLHGAVAARIAQEADDAEEVAGILSMHYLIAGDNRSAWRFATIAGKRAAGFYAYVEAARLYARALDAGRRLDDVGAPEIAAVHEALGDAWYQTSEFKKAADSYTAARKLMANDPLANADLLLKFSYVETKLGRTEKALRWIKQARAGLSGVEGQEAALQTARAGAWYAEVLQFAGRTKEALRWAERAVAEAEVADDPKVLGRAYLTIGLAYSELGKEGAVPIIQRSLEAFQRGGHAVGQSAALNNLGVVCQLEGLWDEALSYYEHASEVDTKIGSTLGAPLSRMNIAEILTDRGEWAEAEALLVATLPFWKAARHRYFLAICLLYLGRISLRTGRLDESLRRLEEAKANLQEAGAEQEIPAVDACIAECRATMGDADAALALVRAMLPSASPPAGVAKLVPQLERVRGHALLQKGDTANARAALDTSLAAAREQRKSFEAALTILSLIELDRREGVKPPSAIVAESRSILARLKIKALPPLPLPAP